MTADARDLLDRLARRYRELRTYADRGVVTIEIVQGEDTHVLRRPFTTAFVRPDQFRFEFQESRVPGRNDRYIVWQAGERVRTYWTVGDRLRDEPNLSGAIAGATGVSGGSALTIPKMLMPGIWEDYGSKILDLEDARLEDAVVIVGHSGRGRPFRVTVDPALLLVTRIEEGAHPIGDSGATSSQVTAYEPSADVAIEPALLRAEFPDRES